MGVGNPITGWEQWGFDKLRCQCPVYWGKVYCQTRTIPEGKGWGMTLIGALLPWKLQCPFSPHYIFQGMWNVLTPCLGCHDNSLLRDSVHSNSKISIGTNTGKPWRHYHVGMQMANDKRDLEVLENSQMVRLVYSFMSVIGYFTNVTWLR